MCFSGPQNDHVGNIAPDYIAGLIATYFLGYSTYFLGRISAPDQAVRVLPLFGRGSRGGAPSVDSAVSSRTIVARILHGRETASGYRVTWHDACINTLNTLGMVLAYIAVIELA